MGSWRRFAFFQQRELGQPSLFQAGVSACCGLDEGGLALADVHGVVHLLDRGLTEWCAFGAHDKGVTQLAECGGLLLTFGLEADGPAIRACMRAWRPQGAGTGELQGTATCLRTLRIFGGPPEPSITCVAASGGPSQIAIGLDDGQALLLRCAELLKDRFLKFKPLPSLAKHAGAGTEPVTAVHFAAADGEGVDGAGEAAHLFVARRDAIFSVTAAGLRGESCAPLNEGAGADAGLCCTSDRNDLVVGRPEAIYFYTADERGPCFAFGGEKYALCWHRSYLVVAAADGHGGAPGPGAIGHAGGYDPSQQQQQQQPVHVYDLKNKLIAHHTTVPSAVRWVISSRLSVLIVCADGRILSLEEHPLSTKLESLFRKSLYPTALSLAASQCFEPSVLGEIHLKYAEHLYGKGDYDGAVEHFVATIGHAEPSRAIRRSTPAMIRIRYLQSRASLFGIRLPHLAGSSRRSTFGTSQRTSPPCTPTAEASPAESTPRCCSRA